MCFIVAGFGQSLRQNMQPHHNEPAPHLQALQTETRSRQNHLLKDHPRQRNGKRATQEADDVYI